MTRVDLLGFAHVGGLERGRAPVRPRQRLGLVAPADHHLGSRLEESLADAAAHAPAAAGHDDHAPVKSSSSLMRRLRRSQLARHPLAVVVGRAQQRLVRRAPA